MQPSGVRSYIVNYRAGGGGRKAANRRLVIGRHRRMTPEQARRAAHETLGRVAAGEDPAGDRARSRNMPTLRETYADYLAAGPERKPATISAYNNIVHRHLKDWLDRPLDNDFAQGCGAVLPSPHPRGRAGAGKWRGQDALLPLPAPVHRRARAP